MKSAVNETETRGRKPKAARNAAIVRDYRHTNSLSRTAKAFGVSRQRVSQIVQAAKRGA